MQTSLNTVPLSADKLKTAWQTLRSTYPHLRIREAAASLGVAEAELLATGCGDNVVRLTRDWQDILTGISELGPVMGLTRNDAAVHEITGLYQSFYPADGLSLLSGPSINTALLTGLWDSGFAVSETTPIGERHSLQFFDAGGQAAHKIYLTDSSDMAGYRQLTETYRAVDQTPTLRLRAVRPAGGFNPPPGLPEIWQLWFKAGFFCSSETVAVKYAAASSFPDFMQQLADIELPLQIMVCNATAIQIHTGPIRNLKVTGPWFNVLDEGFNLHLKQTALAGMESTAIVHGDARLNGLILRDAAGRAIASLFGHGDAPIWNDLLAALPHEPGRA